MKNEHYQRNKKNYLVKAKENKEAYKQWWKEYKDSLYCEECGEDHPATIDFHHEGDKEIEVSNAIRRGWGKERVMVEVAKCKVLCANCHRKLHWYSVGESNPC